jgi:hypothetical protein
MPLPAQPDQVAWACPTCGQALLLDEGQGLRKTEFHYAANLTGKGKPVWVATGRVSFSRSTFAGNDSGSMNAFWNQPRTFFVAAYALPLEQVTETGVRLLRQPLTLKDGGQPAPFEPVVVPPADVRPLAEFIIVSIEAERKDKLRALSFTLELETPQLWILP